MVEGYIIGFVFGATLGVIGAILWINQKVEVLH